MIDKNFIDFHLFDSIGRINIKKFKKIYGNVPIEYSWCKTDSEFLYSVYNNLKSSPKCYCGNKLKFISFKKGYYNHCSIKCSNNDEKVKNKYKNTCLEKYGVENVFQFEDVKDKIKKSNLERYGVEYPQQSEMIHNKTIISNLERYGVEHPLQSEEIKIKTKETILEKYGVENPSQVEEIKRKKRETSLFNYGVDNPAKSNEIKEKTIISNLKRYGVEYPQQLEMVKNKISDSKSINMRNYYNEKRNVNCFVYVVESKIKNKIKIGITSNLKNRIKDIKKDFGEDSIYVFFQYFVNASDWECYLHNKYNNFCLVEKCGGGKTEWFDICIKNDVIQDLNDILKGI